ncbi:hypothetical protein Nepgr_008179 [Nepenthes gracilis]|uniref:AP2/ERF domain-containing protein n=1 Tax=Nepenthes gracilis TaxID=150966 RepID=A0AAD3S8L2_NEPGR|nr:hypothetical protein Nepgr_008179 [Nepenthes gracilis]
MKSMNNDENCNGNNSGWLGFSLSPQSMSMEASSAVTHHDNQTQTNSNADASTVLPTATFFHTTAFLNYNSNVTSFCYGLGGEIGGFNSPTLPVMPLKSDGSLCTMHGIPPTPTPKLEDFFGGETGGHHDREDVALGLDGMFYHHNLNSQNFTHPFYSSFRGNEVIQMKETQVADCHILLPTMAENEISGLKNCAPTDYTNSSQGSEQKMIYCMGGNHGGQSGSVGSIGYEGLQSLRLSMSPSSQSSCVTGSHQISPAANECSATETRKKMPEKQDHRRQIVHRKSLETFGQRTSQYRGVTRHRWTGRYEAHLWDNSCRKEGQSRKGRQGGYDTEEKAARAYDLAALKYWGPSSHNNFPIENYRQEMEDMKKMTRQEYVAHLRRNSSGFSRGASMYRGVTRHHQHGRWQARIGRVAGNKDLYLGTFCTQEEAAEAYDIAAIKFRGANAVTNFNITRYDVERIMASNTLLAGELARRDREIRSSVDTSNHINTETIESGTNDEGESDKWNFTHYYSTKQLNSRCIKYNDQNTMTARFHEDPSISIVQNSLMKIDGMSSVDHHGLNDSAKVGTHVSNSSSLITSYQSSREHNPDKGSIGLPFSMPPLASRMLIDPANDVNTWMPTMMVRPAIAVSQLHSFANWADL